MLPAHFLLCVLSCIAFSGGEWVAEVKIELGNLNVNKKYGTLILHEDQRSTARPADTFLNIENDSSKIIFHVVSMFIVSEYFY